jgi:hypothetical protein
VIAGVIHLALHAAGMLALINAAHAGERLVHEFGVRASVSRSAHRRRRCEP